MMWQTDSIQCKKGHIDIEGKEGCFTKGQVDVFQVTGRTKLYNWAFHPPQYICSMCILHETMWSNKTELSKQKKILFFWDVIFRDVPFKIL